MAGGHAGDLVVSLKPVVGMVSFQVVFAGLNILYKLAVSDGMDLRVLVAYLYMFASAVIAPLAYFVERYATSGSDSDRRLPMHLSLLAYFVHLLIIN